MIAFFTYLLSTFLEEIGPAEKSRMESGEEPHAAREPRVGQPCSRVFGILAFVLAMSEYRQ